MRKTLLVLVTLAVFPSLRCIPGYDTWRPHHWGYLMWFGGGAFMWILFLVLLGVVIYFIWKSTGKTIDESPLDILKRRYAKGEITKEEFDGMKRDLKA